MSFIICSNRRPLPLRTIRVLILTCLILIFAESGVGPTSATMVQGSDPLALVKSIAVAGQQTTNAAIGDVKVTRANGLIEPARADLILYFGDEVTTGNNGQVTLLFLDAVTEKDNEVFVDSASRVRIGSIFTWLGRVFIQCRGAFDTKTQKVRLGVQGTQFEVIVQRDGTNRITVLEGVVSVEKLDAVTGNPLRDQSSANFVQTSFRSSLPQQKRLELNAVAGESRTVTSSFTFENSCTQRHQYQIQGPSNMGWLRILGADRFEIAGGQSRTITFAIELDGRNLQQGTYEGDIIARCLDCGQDPSCNLAGLLLPVSIKVGAAGGGQPPAATQETRVSASRLQEVVIDNSGMRTPVSANESKVTAAIDWSTNVILASEPSYSAESVAPHFDNSFSRELQFRNARRDAILRNDPGAYEVLGNVYADWGNGAKAIEAYSRARVPDNQVNPEFLTGVAEALRLAGKLNDAEVNLKKALELDPHSMRALNTLGNVQRDRARIARDVHDDAGALNYLKQAETDYRAALAAPEDQPSPTAAVTTTKTNKAVPQANVAEVFLEAGRIAARRGDFDAALAQFSVAETAFGNAVNIDTGYVFARKGLGDLYHTAAEVSQASSQPVRAELFFAKARQEYGRALSLNKDMAEAHVGLGKIAESKGELTDAIREYRVAAQMRPDQPDPHLQLARALFLSGQTAAAAEYAKVFQRLERPSFQQGDNANVARTIISGTYKQPELFAPTPSPTSQPTPLYTPTPIYTPTPVPTPTPVGPLVQVPKMKGDRPQSALAKLQKKGLQGQLRNLPDCEASGKVVSTDPSSEARVQRGTLVTVYVSSLDESAVLVPSLTGTSLERAAARLQQAGLGIKVGRKEETDAASPDTILRQKPSGGSRLTRDCQVEVTVAIPIPPVRVPNFIGRNAREVEQTMFLSGLSAGELREVESERPEGTVIDQYPRPGELVPRGTQVNLVISQITFVEVPNVVGHSLGGAIEILSGLGLTYKVMEGNSKDDVTSQKPAPGTRVPRGTRIQLWFPKSEGPGTLGTSSMHSRTKLRG